MFIGKGFKIFVLKIKCCKKLFDLFSNVESYVKFKSIFEFNFEVLVIILGIVVSFYSEVV